MLIGFSVMFVLYLISRGQMGFGDVKFVAVCGIYLGIWPIIVAVLIGSIIGGVVAAFLLLYGKITRRQYIAYGPYLAIGAAASYVYYMLISKY
jgi:prepilin signal peptidase PulO-like enzyme (type II secretory pathway)